MKPEFKAGDIATFKPFEESHKVIIKEVLPNHFGDNRVIYHVIASPQQIGETRMKTKPVVSFTSGKCIVESKFFERE